MKLFLRKWIEGERRVEGAIRGRPFAWEFHKHTGNVEVRVQGVTVKGKKKDVRLGHLSLHVIDLLHRMHRCACVLSNYAIGVRVCE